MRLNTKEIILYIIIVFFSVPALAQKPRTSKKNVVPVPDSVQVKPLPMIQLVTLTDSLPKQYVAFKEKTGDSLFIAYPVKRDTFVFLNNWSDSVLNYANAFLGYKYKRGGIDEDGFDCSGFTRFVYSKFGTSLPHTSAGQGTLGKKINRSKAKKGDLIFFKGSNAKSRQIGHVGIIVSVEDREITFIHAAVRGGIRYDTTSSPYYKTRYVSVRRITDQ